MFTCRMPSVLSTSGEPSSFDDAMMASRAILMNMDTNIFCRYEPFMLELDSWHSAAAKRLSRYLRIWLMANATNTARYVNPAALL